MPAASSKPEIAFKAGRRAGVAVVGESAPEREGQAFSSYKVIIERTYKDEREGFKSTPAWAWMTSPRPFWRSPQSLFGFCLDQRGAQRK